jgi:single-strand DNA-binding protein
MSSVNKVILVGNVGKDPEIRHTNDGKAIVNLSLATSESWRDKASGERKEKAEWHRIVVFNENIAKIIEQYVRKGDKIYIEGQLQTRKWANKDGIEQYTTEIVLQAFNGQLVLLSGKPKSESNDDNERPTERIKPLTHDLDDMDSVPF